MGASMNKMVLAFFLAFFLFASFGCASKKQTYQEYSEYTLDGTDGTCRRDSDCQSVYYGCNKATAVCTSRPSEWEGKSSVCDYNEDNPELVGFQCGCLIKEYKCAWLMYPK